MEYRLIVVSGDAKNKVVRIKPPTVIGRSRDADLTLGHALVSRRHCEITVGDDGTLIVEDLGSLNGTYHGEERIDEPVYLEPGDLLTIGSVTFRAQYGEGAAATKSKPTSKSKKTDDDIPDFSAVDDNDLDDNDGDDADEAIADDDDVVEFDVDDSGDDDNVDGGGEADDDAVIPNFAKKVAAKQPTGPSKDSAKESAKKSVKSPSKEPVKGPSKEPVKGAGKGSIDGPLKGSDRPGAKARSTKKPDALPADAFMHFDDPDAEDEEHDDIFDDVMNAAIGDDDDRGAVNHKADKVAEDAFEAIEDVDEPEESADDLHDESFADDVEEEILDVEEVGEVEKEEEVEELDMTPRNVKGRKVEQQKPKRPGASPAKKSPSDSNGSGLEWLPGGQETGPEKKPSPGNKKSKPAKQESGSDSGLGDFFKKL